MISLNVHSEKKHLVDNALQAEINSQTDPDGVQGVRLNPSPPPPPPPVFKYPMKMKYFGLRPNSYIFMGYLRRIW